MKIVHVLRAPVGGLFRHVRDLARGQAALGHQVGIICDSTTGGDYAQHLVAELKQWCALGVERHPMSRLPGLGDLAGTKTVIDITRRWQPDVVHGHGAKGGVYARLAGAWLRKRSFYTPHGGSLHLSASGPAHAVLSATEKGLRNIGTGLCFVCNFERDRFDRIFGIKGKPHCVVYNGLWDEEFQATQHLPTASDFLFVGEMRDYKGVDILIEALSKLPGSTASLVGDGPSLEQYRSQVARLDLESRVSFKGRLPMSEAVKLGRIMVLPSRFESFPYVVLETAAAGLPLITSAVGGIPEIVPERQLCIPLTADVLACHMRKLLQDPKGMEQAATQLIARVRKTCSAAEMTAQITNFYTTA